MSTKKLFVVFMAVAMIFSVFTFSAFATYRSESKGSYSWWLSHSSGGASAGASNGVGTIDSFLAVEYANGDWDQDEDSGSSTSVGISYGGEVVLSVCSDHDFYNGSVYDETFGFDFYRGEDF